MSQNTTHWNINLAVIPLRAFVFDGKQYRAHEQFGTYFEKLATHFDEFIICAPVFRQASEEDIYRAGYSYQFSGRNIRFCELPARTGNSLGLIGRITDYIRIFGVVLKNIRKWSAAYIFMPGNIGPITFLLAKLFRKPIIIYIAGDVTETLQYYSPLYQNKLFRVFLSLHISLTELVIHLAVKGSTFVLVAGDVLYNRYKAIGKAVYKRVPITNLSEKDLFYRSDTCQGDTITCLFVGGLVLGKGIIYLLEAIANLKAEGLDVVLNIVGSGNLRSELEDAAERLNINDSVKFFGYVLGGPELFKIYRESDIFILPTLSEGFPRVLYEAMAQSVPIITTNVGGIPGLMKHRKNALLVPPKSSSAIADSIKELVNNQELRQHLIKNGRETVLEILRQDATEQLISLLKHHFPEIVMKRNISCREEV